MSSGYPNSLFIVENKPLSLFSSPDLSFTVNRTARLSAKKLLNEPELLFHRSDFPVKSNFLSQISSTPSIKIHPSSIPAAHLSEKTLLGENAVVSVKKHLENKDAIAKASSKPEIVRESSYKRTEKKRTPNANIPEGVSKKISQILPHEKIGKNPSASLSTLPVQKRQNIVPKSVSTKISEKLSPKINTAVKSRCTYQVKEAIPTILKKPVFNLPLPGGNPQDNILEHTPTKSDSTSAAVALTNNETTALFDVRKPEPKTPMEVFCFGIAMLTKMESLNERETVFAGLIQDLAAKLTSKKNQKISIEAAEEILKIHFILTVNKHINNGPHIILALYPFIETAIFSPNDEICCLGLKFLADFFNGANVPNGKIEQLVQKYLTQERNSSANVCAARCGLEKAILTSNPRPKLNYAKIAMTMENTSVDYEKYLRRKCLVEWLKKITSSISTSNLDDIDAKCFKMLSKTVNFFSNSGIFKVFNIIKEVGIETIRDQELLNAFQELFGSVYSATIFWMDQSMAKSVEILQHFCKNLHTFKDNSADKADFIYLLKLFKEPVWDEKSLAELKLNHPAFNDLELETPTLKRKFRSQQSPSLSFDKKFMLKDPRKIFFSALEWTFEGISNIKVMAAKKPANRKKDVPFKWKIDPENTSSVINSLFDAILEALPNDTIRKIKMLESIVDYFNRAKQEFKFSLNIKNFMLPYSECFSNMDEKFKTSIYEMALDHLESNPRAIEPFFVPENQPIPIEFFKGCIIRGVSDLCDNKRECTDVFFNNLSKMGELILAMNEPAERKIEVLNSLFKVITYAKNYKIKVIENLANLFSSAKDYYRNNMLLFWQHYYKLSDNKTKEMIAHTPNTVEQLELRRKAINNLVCDWIVVNEFYTHNRALALLEFNQKEFEGCFDQLAKLYELVLGSLRKSCNEHSFKNLRFWLLHFGKPENKSSILFRFDETQLNFRQEFELKAHRDLMLLIVLTLKEFCIEHVRCVPKDKFPFCLQYLHLIRKMFKYKVFEIESLDDYELVKTVSLIIHDFVKTQKIKASQEFREDISRFCFQLDKALKRSSIVTPEMKNAVLINWSGGTI